MFCWFFVQDRFLYVCFVFYIFIFLLVSCYVYYREIYVNENNLKDKEFFKCWRNVY